MKLSFCKSILFIASLICSISANAWGPDGHMTGGAIAYYYLKAHNPEVLPKVLATLQNHPWRDSTWAKRIVGLTPEQTNVALFMLASTFPDDARDFPDLGGGKKPLWHYIDYPFVPKGQNGVAVPPSSPNAQERLIALVGGYKAEAEGNQKAQDLCWIFHLIEDVHQPLHTASMFDNALPQKGDRGGNDRYVDPSDGTGVKKLHSYWDDLIVGSFATIPDKAQALLSNPKYAEDKLTELKSHPDNMVDWIKTESFQLAVKNAYQNGDINGLEANPTVLTATYITNANTVAERRIVLAGIRLAKKLATLY